MEGCATHSCRVEQRDHMLRRKIDPFRQCKILGVGFGQLDNDVARHARARRISRDVLGRFAVSHVRRIEPETLAPGLFPGRRLQVRNGLFAVRIGHFRNEAQLLRVSLACRAGELVDHPAKHRENPGVRL
jgi:hypothetical protein